MKTQDRCELADVSKLSAFCAGGWLYLVACGEKPTPCHTVEIRKSPLAIWPPEFSVEVCPGTGWCLQVVTPYCAARAFRVGECPKSIRVHVAGGARDVEVIQLNEWNELKKQDLPKEVLEVLDDIPGPFLPQSQTALKAHDGKQLFEGWSSESYEDAFKNAIDQAGPALFKAARVIDSGGTYGGFVGGYMYYVLIEQTA